MYGEAIRRLELPAILSICWKPARNLLGQFSGGFWRFPVIDRPHSRLRYYFNILSQPTELPQISAYQATMN